MREILFRGRDACGRWHYGVPLVFSDAYVCITDPYTFNKSVERETVGQYTGLTDKNGIKIFEGDIISIQFVEDEYFVEDRIYYENGEVYFDTEHYGWYVRIYDDFLSLWEYDDSEIAVIGNIYDNPELMEG